MSKAVVMQWFDTVEKSLAHSAETSALLAHGTMIGNAREASIEQALGAILPTSVHIGTGKVIADAEPSSSKQVDVVIYDPRFPQLEMKRGAGLYFVEGVIATIEVKSTLDQESLIESLNNCASVMELAGQVNDLAHMNRAASELLRLNRKDEIF